MIKTTIACLAIAALPHLAQAQVTKLTPWKDKSTPGATHLLISESQLSADTCASKPASTKLVMQQDFPRPDPKSFDRYTYKVTKNLALLRKNHCIDAVIAPNVCAKDPNHTFWGNSWRHMLLAKQMTEAAKGVGVELIWREFPGQCVQDMAKHWEPISRHPQQSLLLSENHTSDDIAVLRSAFGFTGQLFQLPEKGQPR